MVIRLCLMARSTKTQKSLKLNAAHRLLSRGTDVAEAADILSRELGISRRQVYRYLEDARAIGRAVPVAEPLGAGNLQNSQRCIATIARLFCRQRADVERNSHTRREELSDIGLTAAPEEWLGGSGIFLR